MHTTNEHTKPVPELLWRYCAWLCANRYGLFLYRGHQRMDIRKLAEYGHLVGPAVVVIQLCRHCGMDRLGDRTEWEWIDWAEGVWDWQVIRETDTLNTKEAKDEKDTKHICPLQLGVIERLVRMYSMPGEVVFSPFAGIGSEGYIALKLGRRFIGVELKDTYYATAKKNLAKAVQIEDMHLALFK